MGRIKKYLKEGEKWFCFELDEFEISKKIHCSEGDDYQVRGWELEVGLTVVLLQAMLEFKRTKAAQDNI